MPFRRSNPINAAKGEVMNTFSGRKTKTSGLMASSVADMIARDVGLPSQPIHSTMEGFVSIGEASSVSDAIDAVANLSANSEVSEVIVSVSLDLIDPNPQNSRAHYTDDLVACMWDEILRADGVQLTPIILSPSGDADGRFWCLDGMTRVMALRLGGRGSAFAVIRNSGTPLQRYMISYLTNNARRKTSDYDDGITWTKMLAAGDITTGDIRAIVGSDRAPHITRVTSIARLPESVQALVSKSPEKVTCNFYYRIYQFMAALRNAGVAEDLVIKMSLEMVVLVVGDDLTIRQLDALISSKTGEASERGSEPNLDAPNVFSSSGGVSRRRIELNGKSIGHISEWANGKMEIKVSDEHCELRSFIRSGVDDLISKYSLSEAVISS